MELDRRLAELLRQTNAEAIEAGTLRLVEGDILDEDIPKLIESPYEVVANVPYHITSPILHRFLGTSPRPTRLVLMLQREVAERIAAAPGDMSYLSVFVQYHAEVRIAFVVPRDAFEPPPEVESAVVEIRPLDPLGTAPAARPGRRRRSVAPGPGRLPRAAQEAPKRDLAAAPVSGDIVLGALEAVEIDRDRRPQTLSVTEWLALREAIGPLPGRHQPEGPQEARRPAGPPARRIEGRLEAGGRLQTRRGRGRRPPERQPATLRRGSPADEHGTRARARRPVRAGQAEPHPGGHRPARRRFPLPPFDHVSADPRRCPDGPSGGLGRDVRQPPRVRTAGERGVRTTWSSGPSPGPRDAVAQAAARPGGAPALLAALLSKRIPVAAGLGGGSSDAAAAIDAALGAWGVVPARSGRSRSLAAALGSDVPFFQAGCGAVVTGRGENVEPLPPMTEPAAILLVTPRLAVSTEAVFRAYAGGARPAGDAALRISEELAAELRRSPVPSVLLDRAADLALANDLVPATAATAPGLPGFTAALTSLLERPVCQSGSGPSLWSVYATLDEARRAMKKVRQAVAGGSLPAVGDGEPFIAATLIAARPLAWRPAGPQTDASPPEPPDLPLAGRPRAVHNWPDAGKRGPHDPGRPPGSGGA